MDEQLKLKKQQYYKHNMSIIFFPVEFTILFSTLLLFKYFSYKINIYLLKIRNLLNFFTRYFLVPASYGHSYSTHVGMARERFSVLYPEEWKIRQTQ